MKYFAYGSNLSSARLRKRVSSACFIGVYKLRKYELRFHKSGKDGSAKCNAFHTGYEVNIVEGAVFELEVDEIIHLDRVEGLGVGYEKNSVEVFNINGDPLQAFTYLATDINDSLLPFSWYKNHVLVGAKSCGLSPGYIEKIMRVRDQEDRDKAREKRELAIHEPIFTGRKI
jgi:gamma-glutamylcyclotransferase (GGCT)/AIG2-like uncharacterized protein YtfP